LAECGRLVKAKAHEAASDLLEEYLAEQPEDPLVLRTLGRLRLLQGRPIEAAVLLKHSLTELQRRKDTEQSIAPTRPDPRRPAHANADAFLTEDQRAKGGAEIMGDHEIFEPSCGEQASPFSAKTEAFQGSMDITQPPVSGAGIDTKPLRLGISSAKKENTELRVGDDRFEAQSRVPTVSHTNAAQFDMGKLPSIPHVLLQLIEVCSQEDVTYERLTAIIQKDVALSSKIITICNSPTYAQWNKINDFQRLLVVLGLSTIRTIAITAAVHQFFSQFSVESGRAMGQIWHRSLSCACVARELARLTRYEAEDEAYLSGLLHKLGQLIMLKQHPDNYSGVLFGAGSSAELSVRERDLFGTTSAELGALIIRGWNLDSFLDDAVLYQEEPGVAVLDAPRLVRLLNLAHKMSDPDTPREILAGDADLLFGLSQPVLNDLRREVREEVHRTAQGLGIELTGEGGEAGYQAETESVRLELAHIVRDIALVDGVRQHLGEEQQLENALEALFRDLNILFGLSRSLCFLHNPKEQNLIGAASYGIAGGRLAEFSIQLATGRSLVAESALVGHPLSSLHPPSNTLSSIVDSQLGELLGTEGILCLPLGVGTTLIGVLVAGIDKQKQNRLEQQKILLGYFSQAATAALGGLRQHQHAQELAQEATGPLALIRDYLQVLTLRLHDDQVANEKLEVLQEEVERVAGIVLQMRDVEDGDEAPGDVVDLNALMKDLLAVFQVYHFNSRGITALVDLDQRLPAIVGNPNSLRQILTNLLKNAVEALPDGGTLMLSTRDRVNVGGRAFVEITLADNGQGIATEMLEQMFQPVRSSKGPRHSGLGLAIVHKLVSRIGGSISCSNRKQGGAEFVLRLPRRPATEK